MKKKLNKIITRLNELEEDQIELMKSNTKLEDFKLGQSMYNEWQSDKIEEQDLIIASLDKDLEQLKKLRVIDSGITSNEIRELRTELWTLKSQIPKAKESRLKRFFSGLKRVFRAEVKLSAEVVQEIRDQVVHILKEEVV